MEKFISDFISDAKKEMASEKPSDGYYLILYKTKPRLNSFGEESITHKIYSSLEIFEQKVKADIEKIPSEFGVRVQIWYFD